MLGVHEFFINTISSIPIPYSLQPCTLTNVDLLAAMLDIRKPTRRYIRSPKSVGGWLPPNKADVLQWVKKMADMSKANPPPRSGPVKALETLINNNAEVYMLFHEMMVEAVAGMTACGKKPIDFPISDVAHLLDTLDVILTTGPAFFSAGDPQIGTPINALLVWPMATKAGFAVFTRSDVNHAIKGILDYWGAFLKSPNSRSVLTNAAGGWFSADALADPHMRDFDKTYICDPTMPYWGFTSWDNFFTREFKPNLRPVCEPKDDSCIVNAAESTFFNKVERVHLRDNFWLKGQPYSLYHMLDGDARASQFVNGSVYQAFLSADSYHRWHAPVSGRIVDYKIVPGTYYSEPILFGFDPDDGTPAPDAGADENSQGYISAVAARGLLWIQADNPKIGLMCMVFIGMAEVSTIDVTMAVNKHFQKGEQLGMFHFGGSSHCLVFGPHVKLNWKISHNQVHINSELARVK